MPCVVGGGYERKESTSSDSSEQSVQRSRLQGHVSPLMQENMIKVADLEKRPALMYKLDMERSDSRYNLSARVLVSFWQLDPPAFYRRQN